ncbi:MAG: RNA polymerase sigma-54 factor [Gammaproteobacteria bacterium]|nr:MAG: RNA polymerase sigma-54 factor [Gammaproteobacteria bacterium]
MSGLKQGIQLKQSQTLAVTPQLQQSLKILQCNQLELEAEISHMLEENIMLERLGADDDFILDNGDLYDESTDISSDTTDDTIPDEIELDIKWDDLYDDPDDYDNGKNREDSEGFQDDWVADQLSFDEQLEQSIRLSGFNDEEKRIASGILAHLDEHYFLTLPHTKLAQVLKTDISTLQSILDVIKHLDPPGVGSCDVRECLLAQLHSLPAVTDSIADAHDILTDYYTYLGQKESLIKRRLGLSDAQFSAALQIIRGLSPYPTSASQAVSGNIRADVFVRQHMSMFYVSLNQDARHDIGINAAYAGMIKQCKGDEKNFMRAQLQTAKFFLKALDQRQQTILRVTNAIVMQQQDYFIDGEKALRPLKMKDIAELLDIAESTVSRAVNGKYLLFNQRLIELRHFFAGDLSGNSNTEADGDTAASTTAAKALIKEIINAEDPKKPLSDSKLEKLLKEKDIDIARRTITKYRESLGIPKSSERKRRR